MYSTSGDDQLGGAGKETLEAIRMIEAVNRGPYVPARRTYSVLKPVPFRAERDSSDHASRR